MHRDPFDLTGKGVIVTGGNGGIGLGMAIGLARAGAGVCIWGTNPDKNAAALAQLKESASAAYALECDVSDELAVESCFAQSVEMLGRVDACFANAGVVSDRRAAKAGFAGLDLDEWQRLMQVNVNGTFLTLRAAAKHMLQIGIGGSLVITSSLSSIRGMPRGEHYAASKGALNALVLSLAAEYGHAGIRTNGILPGWIRVERNAPTLDWQRMADAVLPRIPLGRWGEPEDMAGIAVYLASDASRYHSGDLLVIDGGHAAV
jgi:NAD(P)-dependent dehydrogenase (short-subunit alcohol dehydrogenase family)